MVGQDQRRGGDRHLRHFVATGLDHHISLASSPGNPR
jgi:hypothetical protein